MGWLVIIRRMKEGYLLGYITGLSALVLTSPSRNSLCSTSPPFSDLLELLLFHVAPNRIEPTPNRIGLAPLPHSQWAHRTMTLAFYFRMLIFVESLL